MRLQFQKLVIHNFLSYGHAEIDLRDKGYCLVSGINQCPKDNALSNGSGKSSWTSAICWALTGETINGLTQNIKNINVEENLCYVCLELKANNDNYKITRYKEPKTDLKVIINGEDKSGKGIRESEAILATYLPDLTANLIASIIILGQGLPCKFSNNTPSGRKEVLEKLSKSDFMINDLKLRLNNRLDILLNLKRKYEDAILSAESKKTVLNSQLVEANKCLEELNKPHNFSEEIAQLKTNISTLEKSINERKTSLTEAIKQVNGLNLSLNKLLEEKAGKIKEDTDDFNAVQVQYVSKKSQLQATIKSLEAEIKRLKSITDICPTCGQKIPGAIKPDTTEQSKQVESAKSELEELEKKYLGMQNTHNAYVQEIENEYKKTLSDLNSKISTQTTANETEDHDIRKQESTLLSLRQDLGQIEIKMNNHLKELENINKTITSLQNSIKILENEILYNNGEKESICNHINVINQMNTLIKRDFRGFLLSNVIAFIDSKAKEYAKNIFGTDELKFELEGNNIDIVYCNKMFESLSGGEKQKVDLIIQFAIRDMMSRYLDFSSNILILDEITDNLDAIGCTNVLNLISSTLNDVESVFIISHHADELQIPCDTQFTVVKDRQGISSIKFIS